MIICGTDEAGRGPLIGPLVMAGISIDAKNVQKLRDLGIKDSKLLNPLVRERLFDEITKICKYEIIILTAQEVDNALLTEGTNLNYLEADTTAKIINKLNPDKAIIDSPSPNLKAYEQVIQSQLTKKIPLVVEHKADLNYVESAAASILAKVTRDREIQKIKKKIGKEFGSGYPADPITRAFIEKHWQDYPEIFRKTWSTYKKLAQKKAQKTLV